MSQELQTLGMDVTTKPAQGYSDWNANITGTPSAWQTAIHWGNGGSIPYIQFQNWLDGIERQLGRALRRLFEHGCRDSTADVRGHRSE